MLRPSEQPTPSQAAPRALPWPPLVTGEEHWPQGRALGALGGTVWLRDAWSLYRRQALAWHLLSLPLVVLLLGLALDERCRVPALVLWPLLAGVLAAAARLSWRREEISLSALRRALHGALPGLLTMGVVVAALWFLPLMVLARTNSAQGQETPILAHMVADLLCLAALSFSAFLHCEQGLGPVKALYASVLGFVKNLPAVIELLIVTLIAAIIITGPFYLLWVFAFSSVPMRFAHMLWMMAVAILFMAPTLGVAVYVGYRAIFIEEPPPEQDLPPFLRGDKRSAQA